MDPFIMTAFLTVLVGMPVIVVFLFVFAVHKLTDEAPRPGRRPGAVLGLLLGFVAGIIVWFAWLSWDLYYTNDLGQTQGPYQPWQVVACGATMIAVTVALGLWTRWTASGPFYVAIGATGGFSLAWGLDALPQDDTGLSGVGLLMVVTGVGVGLNVAAALTSIGATIWKKRLPSNA